MEAWWCVSNTIIKYLQYPLIALILIQQEYHDLVVPIYDICLPRSHIYHKSRKDLVYGDSSVLGLGLDDLYINQDVSCVNAYITHLHDNILTDSLIQSSLERSTIHVGVERNLLSLDYDLHQDLLSRSWINILWWFAWEYRISLPSTDNKFLFKRGVDVILMENNYTPLNKTKGTQSFERM
jgi:hypothetical protein